MGSAGDNGFGEVRYAKSGGVNVACRTSGSGSADLVFIPGWISHLDVGPEDPGAARFATSLHRFARVVEFDKRGTGLSDRVPDDKLPTMEERMDDIRAVMDAVGLERASILGFSEGGALAMLFAATYPERTTSLVIWGSYPSMIKRPDYEWGMTQADLDLAAAAYLDRWGTGVGLGRFVPSRAHDAATRAWWGRLQRSAASPGAAIALLRMNAQIDVRGVLSAISAPTLILHRRDDFIAPFGHARYLAEHIAGARVVAFEGQDHWPWIGGDLDQIVAEIEEFLTGARGAPEPERALATVLFTDIVGSTERAVEVGDARWRELLQRHDAMVRAELIRPHPDQAHIDRLLRESSEIFLTLERSVVANVLETRRMLGPQEERRYLDLTTRTTSRRATRLLADSEATKRDLIAQYGVDADKIAVVYPGVEGLRRATDEQIAAARARYNLPERYLLFLGTLQPRKNIRRLIEAHACSGCDVPLVLAGKSR